MVGRRNFALCTCGYSIKRPTYYLFVYLYVKHIMDEQKIIQMYQNEGYTLRHISEIFKTNHHTIKRLLIRNNIEITRRKTLKIVSEETRKKIGNSSRGRICWLKGKKHKLLSIQNIIYKKIRYNIPINWLSQFENWEKFRFLSKLLKKEKAIDTNFYINFIEKFYYDDKFNQLYDKWKETNDKWIMPSLDHIIPVSKIGNLVDLNNLQIISWLENWMKVDIDQSEWNIIKQNIYKYF